MAFSCARRLHNTKATGEVNEGRGRVGKRVAPNYQNKGLSRKANIKRRGEKGKLSSHSIRSVFVLLNLDIFTVKIVRVVPAMWPLWSVLRPTPL